MNRLLNFALAAIFIFSALFACAGCDPVKDAGDKDESLDKVLSAGKLVLGLDASFPPMGFTDENGEIVGFDIDVAAEVCRRLGVELVKQPIEWKEKENLLNNGEIDCIWNGMSVTAERAEDMNLSEPYMKNEMIFVVRRNGAIKTTGDLKGKTVGVQSGSTATNVLKTASFYAELTVVEGGDNVGLLKDLEDGKTDAVFVDSIVAYYYIKTSTSKTLFVLPGNLQEEEYAVGFRKGDKALRDKVQEILYEMNADGTLAGISKKWFESDITSIK